MPTDTVTPVIPAAPGNVAANVKPELSQEPAEQLTAEESAVREKQEGPPVEPAGGGVTDTQAPAASLGAPQPPSPGAKDLRATPRYMVSWKIAIVFDEKEETPTIQGKTYDLSMGGTAMLTHNNVFAKTPVTILLAPPPLRKGGGRKIIEIQANLVYSVYSGALSCFRLGLNFTKFKGDGKGILKEMLAYYQPSSYRGDKLLK